VYVRRSKWSRGFDRGCNLAEQSQSQTTWNPSMWLAPLQPYPGPAVLCHIVLPYILTIKPYTIPPIKGSCHPSPCDMGLSAMDDNDGASPSTIVPMRLLVEIWCSLAATLPTKLSLLRGYSVHLINPANAAGEPRPRCIADGSDRRQSQGEDLPVFEMTSMARSARLR
jgi:hypothetical protein